MQQAVEHLQQELAGVRTGRAHPGLLENLLVDVEGDHIPIKACGSVTVRNPQLLAVVLFDGSVSTDLASVEDHSICNSCPAEQVSTAPCHTAGSCPVGAGMDQHCSGRHDKSRSLFLAAGLCAAAQQILHGRSWSSKPTLSKPTLSLVLVTWFVACADIQGSGEGHQDVAAVPQRNH